MHGRGIRLSGDFHLQLAKISSNTTLTRFIREHISHFAGYRAVRKAGFVNCPHSEQFELIDIISKGDAESTVSLTNEYLLDEGY